MKSTKTPPDDEGASMSNSKHLLPQLTLACAIVMTAGCAHVGGWGWGGKKACKSHEAPCEPTCDNGTCACEPGGACESCEAGCGPCAGWYGRCCSGCANLESRLFGWMYHQSNAVPDILPLGSTVRAHYQVMETNAEAADFIFHRHDFVGRTVELTPDARDKIPEIAARMRMQPFPVLIERSEHNSDPGLDQQRRAFVARILTDLGAPEADRRTIVAPAYGKGYHAIQAERTFYQYLNPGSFNTFGNGGFGNVGTGFGGFTGGGFGGF